MFGKNKEVLIYLHSSDGKVFETYDSLFKNSALIHYYVAFTTNRNICMPCIKAEYLRMIIGFANHYKDTKFLDEDLSAIGFENVAITNWDEQFFNLSENKFRTLLESAMHLNMLSLIIKGIKCAFCNIGNPGGKPIQKCSLDYFDFLPESHSFSQTALDYESLNGDKQCEDHETTLESKLLSALEEQIALEIPQEQKMDVDLKNKFATTADIAEAAVMSAVSEAAGSLTINDRPYITRMPTGISMPIDKKYVCSTSDEIDDELPTTSNEALQHIALAEAQKWEKSLYSNKYMNSISKK